MLLVQSQAYRDQYGFNSIFLLPVNLYGPVGQLRSRLVARHPGAHPQVRRGGRIRRLRDRGLGRRQSRRASSSTSTTRPRGSCWRPNATTSSEPVNLGSAFEISIRELVERIAARGRLHGANRVGHEPAERSAAAKTRHRTRGGGASASAPRSISRPACAAQSSGTAIAGPGERRDCRDGRVPGSGTLHRRSSRPLGRDGPDDRSSHGRPATTIGGSRTSTGRMFLRGRRCSRSAAAEATCWPRSARRAASASTSRPRWSRGAAPRIRSCVRRRRRARSLRASTAPSTSSSCRTW